MLTFNEQELKDFEAFLKKFPGEFCIPVIVYLQNYINDKAKAVQEGSKEKEVEVFEVEAE